MDRLLCSVVLATYQRDHLLARSLEAYSLQDFPDDQFELIVIDDHSTDNTRELVLDWSNDTGIAATVLTTAPKPEKWRDCGAILNAGIRASSGQHIILTHPEVIPGRASVKKLVENLECFEMLRRTGRLDFDAPYDPKDDPLGLGPLPRDRGPMPIGLYAACKVYYLRPVDQLQIDAVDWRGEGALAVRKIPGFYDEDMSGNPDYRHCVTDAVATKGFKFQTWDSWVFGGCSRETWKRLGGMWVTQRWGAVDVGFNHRRKKLEMAEWTCPDDDSIVVHQFHGMPGDVETPRIEEEWKKELDAMDKGKLCYPEVNELYWEA